MWKDWTEPLEVLLTKANEFLKQFDFSSFPRGGVHIGPAEIRTRPMYLARAFIAYIDNVFADDFLQDYVYTASVYKDVYDLVCEYIGENEHAVALHGDEFAQTEEALIKDFCLYIEN